MATTVNKQSSAYLGSGTARTNGKINQTGSNVVIIANNVFNAKIPYAWGGANPKIGFDCSGLIFYILTIMGFKNVPRTSADQFHWATHITQGQLKPGDLVFYYFPNESGNPGSPSNPNHVGIFTGIGGYNGKNVPLVFMETGPNGAPPVYVPFSTANVVGYGRVPGIKENKPGDSGGAIPVGINNLADDVATKVAKPIEALASPFAGLAKDFALFGAFGNFIAKIGFKGVFLIITGVIIFLVGLFLLFRQPIENTVKRVGSTTAKGAALAV